MASASQIPWYRYTPKGWRHFQSVPFSRLLPLLLGVFFLFSTFGFFSDILNGGQWPYSIVAMNVIASGLIAIAWVVVLSRLPMFWLAGLMAFQFLSPFLIDRVDRALGSRFPAHPATAEAGVHIASYGLMVLIVVSYVMFITFIRGEGKEAFKLRNELELAHGIQKTLVPPFTLRTARRVVSGIQRLDEQGGN